MFSKPKNGIPTKLNMILTGFNIPNKNHLQRTQEIILQNLKSQLQCFRLLPFCLMFPFTAQVSYCEGAPDFCQTC